MLFAALALFSSAGNADTGDSNRVIKATRATVLPVIDGRIGENEWPDATRASGFTDLVTGKPALEPTEAYISYDETFLYVAFKAYDKVPTGIIAREVLRDSRYSGGGDFGDNDEGHKFATGKNFLTSSGKGGREKQKNVLKEGEPVRKCFLQHLTFRLKTFMSNKDYAFQENRLMVEYLLNEFK